METGTYAAADYALSERAQERVRRGTPANTGTAYVRQWRLFVEWCAGVGRVSLPATAETLTEYVAKLADDDLAVVTIRQAVAAIRATHRAEGHPAPATDGSRLVLRDHARRKGQRPKKAPPIVVDTLRAMVGTCDLTTLRGLRDRLVVVLGVTIVGRRSELAALEMEDVHEVAQGLTVVIRTSKTDKDSKGESVAVLRGENPETDPVAAVRAWRSALAARGITAGPLLRSVDRHGRVGASLTGKAINNIVRARAVAADLPDADRYTAHGLRAGGVSVAYENRAPIAAITALGRFADGSSVVLGYIRAVDKWKQHPMRGAGL